MAETVKTEPYASVYVLDAHYQYKDLGVVSVFSSPAGRAVMSNSTSSPQKSAQNTKMPPQNQQQRPPTRNVPSRRSNGDLSKFVLNPKSLIENTKFRENGIEMSGKLKKNNSNSNKLHDDRENSDLTAANDAFFNNGNNEANVTLTGNLDFRDGDVTLKRRLVGHRGAESNCSGDREQIPLLSQNERSSANGNDDKMDARRQDGERARSENKILRYGSSKDILGSGRFSSHERCALVRRILGGLLGGLLGGRTRKPASQLRREAALALGVPCELTDNCRCLDCQCHYFDCGDTDSEASDISMSLFDIDSEEWAYIHTTSSTSQNRQEEDEHLYNATRYENDANQTAQNSENFCVHQNGSGSQDGGESQDPPPSCSACVAQNGVAYCSQCEDLAPSSLEMAAGTPVLLDHLLNNPMSCTIQ